MAQRRELSTMSPEALELTEAQLNLTRASHDAQMAEQELLDAQARARRAHTEVERARFRLQTALDAVSSKGAGVPKVRGRKTSVPPTTL